MEHYADDHAASFGGPGLPFDQRHHRQHRHPGHRAPDYLRRRHCGQRDGFSQPRPDGNGADRGRKPDADFLGAGAGQHDAELRLFPHAVLSRRGGRPGVESAVYQHLRQPRPFLHGYLSGGFLVDARRTARHLRDVPLYEQRNDDRPSRRHHQAGRTALGEPLQNAAQHSVCHQVSPLGLRRYGAA